MPKGNIGPRRENKEQIMENVRKLIAEGKTVAQAARELDVPVSTIYHWLKQEREETQKQAPSPEPAAAANQEPIQGSQEPAEPSVSQLENEVKETYEDLAKQEREQQGFGPEDEEPIPYQVVGKYESLGKAIGALVDEKNLQYGEAFNRGGCILEILYPDGVRPDQYRDMLGVIRVIDKLFRVANGKQGNEDPWQDIAGYGLLGTGE